MFTETRLNPMKFMMSDNEEDIFFALAKHYPQTSKSGIVRHLIAQEALRLGLVKDYEAITMISKEMTCHEK